MKRLTAPGSRAGGSGTSGGSVTFLGLPRRRAQATSPASSSTQLRHPNPSLVRAKFAALRAKRVFGFFRARAEQRAGADVLASTVGGSSASAGRVLALLRSLRQRASRLFSHGQRHAVDAGASNRQVQPRRPRRRLFPAFLSDARGVLGAVQGALRRVLGPSRSQRRAQKLATQQQERRQQHVALYQRLSRALALLGRSAIATAHKRQRREDAARLAQQVVARLLIELPRTLAPVIVYARELERLSQRTRVIQRCWRGTRRRREAQRDAKRRLLALLELATPRLQQAQREQQEKRQRAHDASAKATSQLVQRAAQRMGARLIQRVWRGHRVRERVRRLRAWRRKKLQRRRQRERLREARVALLEPSLEQRVGQRTLETRVLARQQETPLLPPSRRRLDKRLGVGQGPRRGERATLLEPLPVQTRPPRVSERTGARVQCVPFGAFEKLVRQQARVNLRNVWVAIPVGHHERPQQKEEELHARGDCGLSPVLVGRGRRSVKGSLRTQFDWVPAELLQSREEREVSSRRSRLRARSPATAASSILEPAVAPHAQQP